MVFESQNMNTNQQNSVHVLLIHLNILISGLMWVSVRPLIYHTVDSTLMKVDGRAYDRLYGGGDWTGGRKFGGGEGRFLVNDREGLRRSTEPKPVSANVSFSLILCI